MKTPSLYLIMILILFASCHKKQDAFEIGQQHIGFLTDSTQVKDLETIFKNDSIIKFNDNQKLVGPNNNIEIFDTSGKKLLILTTKQNTALTSSIKSVQIIDERYKTSENISVLSTFKDLVSAYKINRISNLINSILITVNQSTASFVIDKNELPANLRFDMDLKIEPTHIPDKAKIKYFFVNWNQ